MTEPIAGATLESYCSTCGNRISRESADRIWSHSNPLGQVCYNLKPLGVRMAVKNNEPIPEERAGREATEPAKLQADADTVARMHAYLLLSASVNGHTKVANEFLSKILFDWSSLKAQLAAQPSVQRDELVSAINWACGCGDDDFVPTAGASGFLGTFWWRSELVKKSGLTWDRDKQRYILAERGNGER